MEAISMNGLNRPATIFNMQDSNFEKDALFYSSKPIGRKELTDVVAFELVTKKTDKIYDSIESNGFLFSEEVDLINEDEYAIISDCDDNGGTHRENVTNGETFVTLLLENGHCTEESNKHEPCKEERIKTLNDKNQVSEEVLNVTGDHRNQASNASMVNDEFNSVHINTKPSGKNFENKYNNKKLLGNMNKEVTVVNREEGNDDESDKLFSFENTSTPNKDYEMKIIAGRNDVSELGQSTNTKEVEEEPSGWKEQRKMNRFKLRTLSTRIMRSFEDISVQANPIECVNSIPLEELRNLNSEITDKYDSGNKIRLFPKKTLPVVDLKTVGPIYVPGTHNGTRSIPNAIYANKDIKPVPLSENVTDTTYADKGMKRSMSDIPQKSFDLEMTPLDNHLTSSRLRDLTKERYMSRKKVKDDSFFEIDNRYGEFENNFGFKPIELEMKTLLSRTASNDNIDGLSNTTEFIYPGTSIEILIGCAVSRRYISFFKQQKCDCKYITVAFFNVNEPGNKLNKLDVPCEEVIEEIYTHVIEEIIIYEDELDACIEDPYSICDDEWHIVK